MSEYVTMNVYKLTRAFRRYLKSIGSTANRESVAIAVNWTAPKRFKIVRKTRFKRRGERTNG